MRNLFILFALISFLTSCEYPEEEGGTSSIVGKICTHQYDGIGVYDTSYFAQGERVYILYGNDSVPGDDMRTGPNGDYRFDYLRPGTYRVYAYSDCDQCPSGSEPIYASVEITVMDEVVQAPLIEIMD